MVNFLNVLWVCQHLFLLNYGFLKKMTSPVWHISQFNSCNIETKDLLTDISTYIFLLDRFSLFYFIKFSKKYFLKCFFFSPSITLECYSIFQKDRIKYQPMLLGYLGNFSSYFLYIILVHFNLVSIYLLLLP